MPILETLGEIIGEIFFESIFFSGNGKRLLGKKTEYGTYRTEQKKVIEFSAANKFLLVWEDDVAHLKDKLIDALNTADEKLSVTDFQFVVLRDKTIIQPLRPISFYSFHFLVQWLTEHKIKSIGVVESVRTTYTTYSDPNSENLIGQTDKGKKFFISLMDDYSKRQFLRINRYIETIDEFDVKRIIEDIAHSR